MSAEQDIGVIAHVIQLAVAPVFLLTGIGAFLGVMSGRLARVIDRARRVEGMWKEFDEKARSRAHSELAILRRRARLAYWAINFCTCAALLVCAVVATLFVEAFMGANLKWIVGSFFVLAMIVLIAGLTSFLREVYLATRTLRIGPPD